MKVRVVEDNSVKYLTFKQLVELFSKVNNEEEFNYACGQIDQSFQHEKITWNDNEVLYNLSSRVGRGIGLDIHISNR